MTMTKLQVGITSALAVAGATYFVLQAQTNTALRDDVASLRQENAGIATLQAENLQLARTAAEVADLSNDDAEFARLSDEAVALKARLQQVAHAEEAQAAAASAKVYEVSQLEQQPRGVFQTRPRYPVEMRRAGISGEVTVDFVVDKDGNVQNAFAVKSAQRESGVAAGADDFVVATNGEAQNASASKLSQPAFEAAAIEAVSHWKFSPGRKGGSDVNTHMQVSIVFTISDAPGTAGVPAVKPAEPKP
jgi:outer membrane biosynthesis protein TonB